MFSVGSVDLLSILMEDGVMNLHRSENLKSRLCQLTKYEETHSSSIRA